MSYMMTYPLFANPSLFIGTKPLAVLFGDGNVAVVTTWKEVYEEVLYKCSQDPVYRERLMSMRDRISGRVRMFLASKPDRMTRPVEICEGLYGETHYGSQTLIHILTIRILKPIGYKYSDIKIEVVIK